MKEKMVKALQVAKECWVEAKMPRIYDSSADETGKIALAVIAMKLYDELEGPAFRGSH